MPPSVSEWDATGELGFGDPMWIVYVAIIFLALQSLKKNKFVLPAIFIHTVKQG